MVIASLVELVYIVYISHFSVHEVEKTPFFQCLHFFHIKIISDKMNLSLFKISFVYLIRPSNKHLSTQLSFFSFNAILFHIFHFF